MDLSLTPEQKLLQDSVARFAAEHYGKRKRSPSADPSDGFDRETWREIAALGWLGAGLEERNGGFGGGPVETMVIMEGAGKALMSEPLLATMVMATRLLVETGQSADDIAPLLAGDEIITAALADRATGTLTLARGGQGAVLSGREPLMPYGDAADRFILAAKAEEAGETVLISLPAQASGVSRKGFRTLDGWPAAALAFENTPVSEDEILARGQAADRAQSIAADHAIAALCAEAVGIAQGLFDRTLDYLKQREQFGQPIGRFQALQHRMADMFIALEEARSLMIMATMALTGPEGDSRQRTLSAARLGVLSRTLHIGREAIQLHGGMGMTEELPVGAGFRRLKTLDLIFGGEPPHLERVAATYRQ
ncbi:acyl-CoA dehydrogenase family protein [Rhodoligotrophos ferricapiens]|uniref:acyl-CoA dehydrogenase family protein n=1 Tax=Rhodoligotrophos ferricapiens TaxID=3069264 RepID=UPI00315D9706